MRPARRSTGEAAIAASPGGRVGLAAIALGVLVLAWVAVVWRWQDPVTAFLARREQSSLARKLATRKAPEGASLGSIAAQYRLHSRLGEAMGRIVVPRLDLDAIVVEGTGEAQLVRGPGFYAADDLPGQGGLVYVAGHRTTYGAPFSHIERLRRGDRVIFEMPYGRFVYRVTRHTIVPATDVSVLRPSGRAGLILQACHPRFSATHRYLVYAVPVGGGGSATS
jgi:sortase A